RRVLFRSRPHTAADPRGRAQARRRAAGVQLNVPRVSGVRFRQSIQIHQSREPMSDPQSLQFDRVEYASTPTATTCANCRQQIVQSYYEVNGKLICSRCHEALTQGSDGSRGLRVGRALIAGFGAAVLGAVVWWGVRKLTGF